MWNRLSEISKTATDYASGVSELVAPVFADAVNESLAVLAPLDANTNHQNEQYQDEDMELRDREVDFNPETSNSTVIQNSERIRDTMEEIPTSRHLTDITRSISLERINDTMDDISTPHHLTDNSKSLNYQLECLQKELKQKDDQLNKISQSYQELKSKVTFAEDHLHNEKERYEQNMEELITANEKDRSHHQLQMNEKDKLIVQLKDELSIQKEEMKTQKNQLETQKNQLETQENQLETRTNHLNKSLQEVECLRVEFESKMNDYTYTTEIKIANLEDCVQKLQKDILEKEKELEHFKTMSESHKVDRVEEKETQFESNDDKSLKDNNSSSLKDESLIDYSENDNLKKNLKSLKNDYEALKNELDVLMVQNSHQSDEIKNLKLIQLEKDESIQTISNEAKTEIQRLQNEMATYCSLQEKMTMQSKMDELSKMNKVHEELNQDLKKEIENLQVALEQSKLDNSSENSKITKHDNVDNLQKSIGVEATIQDSKLESLQSDFDEVSEEMKKLKLKLEQTREYLVSSSLPEEILEKELPLIAKCVVSQYYEQISNNQLLSKAMLYYIKEHSPDFSCQSLNDLPLLLEKFEMLSSKRNNLMNEETTSTITKLKRKVSDLELERGGIVEREANEKEQAKKKIQQLEDVQRKLQEKVNSLQEKERVYLDTIENKEEEVLSHNATISQLRGSLTHLGEELEEAYIQIDQLQRIRDSQSQKMTALVESSTKKESESVITKLRHDYEVLSEQAQQAMDKAQRWEKAYYDIKSKLSSLESKSQNREEELLEKLKEQTKESKSMQQLTSELKEAKKECELTKVDAERLKIEVSNLEGILTQIRSEYEDEQQRTITRSSSAQNELKQELNEIQKIHAITLEKMERRISELTTGLEMKAMECDNLSKSFHEVTSNMENTKDSLDRRMVVKLLVTYHESNFKREILELMSKLLCFSEEEKTKVGLHHNPKSSGILSSVSSLIIGSDTQPNSASPTTDVVIDLKDKSFTDAWAQFLIDETK